MDHELKIWPEFFADLVSGVKTYEVRRDDRPFNVRDTIHWREWDPSRQEYTGQEAFGEIMHLTRTTPDGLAFPGICVMGVEVIG